MIDIQAGDVVVCVNVETLEVNGFLHMGGQFLKRGAMYRVAAIGISEFTYMPCLWLDGVDGPKAIERFRKVLKATEEFTARIKAVRPIKQREDA